MIPDGSSASLTVDIEDWYHIPSVCGSTFSVFKDVEEFFKKWEGRYDYLSSNVEKVLRILDQYKIPATFFIVADVIEHYPGLVESIVDHGHEIACHGLHHSCVIDSRTKRPLLPPDAFREATEKAKRDLEKISGEKVVGYRAPNALIAGWMIDHLEEIGFKYDSSVSVNSLYNKGDSPLNGVSSSPYYPVKNGLASGKERRMVEFPWAYWDFLGFKVPTSGGPMLRFLGSHIILKGIAQSLKRGHTVIYFHPIDISPEKFPAIGQGRPLYWMIKGDIVERRIRTIVKHLQNTRFLCLGDALKEIDQI